MSRRSVPGQYRVQKMRHASLGVIAFAVLLCACEATVTRIYDGSTVSERPIAKEAYSAYLRGQLYERDGQMRLAEIEYERVTHLDPSAAEAYTRLGALRCTSQPSEAQRAFNRARELAPRSLSLAQQRARCALQRNANAEALQLAQQALELGPESPSSTFCMVEAYRRTQKLTLARNLAWAYRERHPHSRAAAELLASLYQGKEKEALEAWTLTQMRSLETANIDASYTSEVELIEALLARDTQTTHRVAHRLRLNSLKLALTAYQLGAYDQAHREAMRAVRVAPDHANAWALALILSDLVGDTESFAQLIEKAPPRPLSLSPQLERAFDQLLLRRTQGIAK